MSGEIPDQPRKRPLQKRSKILYASVLEAGADILRDPESELTIELLCQRTGISAGSLYQYFPSKEAVLSEIFRSVVEEEWQKVIQCVEAAADVDFNQGMKSLSEAGVKFVRRLYDLDPDFYRKYVDYYMPYTGAALDKNRPEWAREIETRYIDLISRNPDAAHLSQLEIEQLAFVYTQGAIFMVQNVIEERPEYLHDDKFMGRLIGLFSSWNY